MKSVPQLDLGSIDAVNYRQRAEKEFLSKILYKERFLDDIIDPKKYFLIGEKGTGKTSYATYFENNQYRGYASKIVTLGATDYQKFVQLKEKGKFSVSSYEDVWKVILLLLCSSLISDTARAGPINFHKFNKLRSAISGYYNNAFKPEVDYSLELVKDSESTVKFLAKLVEAGIVDKNKTTLNQTDFQLNLRLVQKEFEDAISPLNLSGDIILFIDGIDIRPDKIDFESYIECIRGLAYATWSLNSEYFANIRDTRGRIKIVLLMRPDILDSMDFQNLNAKVRDNGIVLNWQTTFDEYRSSPLFNLVSDILGKQQWPVVAGSLSWDHYFPFKLLNQQISEKFDNPFVGLLRYSFHRPRDIVQYLQIMRDKVISAEVDKSTFTEKAFQLSQAEHSDYLLGEVKDYLGFYYSVANFDDVVSFFAQLKGRSDFTWEDFKSAYALYIQVLDKKQNVINEIKSGPEEFLQFLYALNMIGYVERTSGRVFVHYCFRDRTPVKLRPGVKVGLSYSVHPGLARALLVSAPRRGRGRFG